MPSNDENIRNTVISIAQDLLLDDDVLAGISQELIGGTIDRVVAMNPKWGIDFDRDAAIEELTRRFSIWIGKDAVLSDETGHRQWLDAARKKDRRYWQRYRRWMERKLSPKAIETLDDSTDLVLGFLEDPTRDGIWDRRGLIVGHVQSGKTGHYTGLVCKAADAGYKVIIVLAGLHNNLRSQTQIRLEEGFLGYETPVTDHPIRIGVGERDTDPNIKPQSATNRTEKGDFRQAAAKHLAITPEERPWLFVVKKNKSVLKQLLAWITHHVADTRDPVTGKGVVTKLPLLLIDDEADHASVDTGENVFDEDGNPDENHQPTAINSHIRKILKAFHRAAYVGYTATPFANIFIHDRGITREEGPDLFPEAFIINLAAPSNYVGPSRLFSNAGNDDTAGTAGLIKTVNDYVDGDAATVGWMPPRHKKGHLPRCRGRNELPPSLDEAINAFILACAVRRLRGQAREHASMLVHVTRYTDVQHHVHQQIAERIKFIRQRLRRQIGADEIIADLRSLWEISFRPTSDVIRRHDPSLVPDDGFSWTDIEDLLPEVVDDIQVRMINGTAKDALDYAENEAIGLKVIAVGGDKLARGLTLEGLCVSYFLRASQMYDTLMQMGRWFGYRPGYFDLCRLYTTSELVEWFGHIADASEELREEFDLMAEIGATPRQYGLKVKSHSAMMVTSRVKMRATRTLQLSFSGQIIETVAFHRDRARLAGNMEAMRRFVRSLGNGEEAPERQRNGHRPSVWQGCVWDGVDSDAVLAFLAAYKTHPDAHKVDTRLLSDFITKMMAHGELTQWTVALIGGGNGEGAVCDFGSGLIINMLRRKEKSGDTGRYSIGRLLSPRDEAIDFDATAWDAALALTKAAWHRDRGRSKREEPPDTPSGPSIRRLRGHGAEGVPPRPERGLLLLYVLDPADGQSPETRYTEMEVAAFAFSFPSSRLEETVTVPYVVNSVLWEQEYGG